MATIETHKEDAVRTEILLIVAWLRDVDSHDELVCPEDIADLIEKGEHRKAHGL